MSTDRSPLDEGALIDAMIARVPHPAAPPEGPGDDAATLGPGGPVVTTDAMIEGVHFLRGHPPAMLGWKLLAVNLSDVAAMGAHPDGFVLSAALPPDLPEGWWPAFSEGLGRYAERSGARLVGGDVVRSGGPIALSLTAWGRTAGDRLLCRRGGRPGDVLMVHGPVGRSHAGLKRWLTDPRARAWPTAPEPADPAILAHLRPEPPLEMGPWALEQGARAGLDLSDGLARDAERLAIASGVTLTIDLERLPADPLCAELSADARVAGGEDYALLVLVPSGRRAAFEGAGFCALGLAGASDGPPGVSWRRDGEPVSLTASPFEHF